MQPEKLGRYQIVREIGRGAMGRVYLAHDPDIDRSVAIKTVQSFAGLPEAEQVEARARFQREARSAGKLLHPGIVTIFDVGDADGVAYIAMELVEGQTLDAFCSRDETLPATTAIELVCRVAEALDFAHGHGIIHRDIKPANLMRTGPDTVKIMDFGLARLAEASLTQDGTLLGTPSYMSPEQIRGETLDGRTDLFSLGVVLFEMLTGQKPFPGDTISSIIYRIVNEEPREAAQVTEGLSADLNAFLLRAMAKDPDGRYPTGESFAAALRGAGGLVQGIPAAAAPAPSPGGVGEDPLGLAAVDESALPPPARSRPKRQTSPVRWILPLLLIGGLGAAGYAFRDRLMEWVNPEPEIVIWQARVSTEPPGLPVLLDGQPLDPALAGVVEFDQQGPYGVLSVQAGCRIVEHPIQPIDAGQEIVLVADPVELTHRIDPGVAGAAVRLNGKSQGQAPVELALDLCVDNIVEIEAPGYEVASTQLAAQVTPLAARTALGALTLDVLPTGTLRLPRSSVSLKYWVDGEPLQGQELALPAGAYRLRYANSKYWIDVSQEIQIAAGALVEPDLAIPALTTLRVQPIPTNCKVYLRKPGGRWKFLDEAPLESRLAAGVYEVKIVLNPTGQEIIERVTLKPGDNAPVRVRFGRGS